MNSLNILLLCFLLACFTIEVKSMKPALVFNPITEQLEELNDGYKKCIICLTACPAFESAQLKINRKISISGNGVFLQAVHRVFYPGQPGSEVHPNVCYASYKPAMVEDTLQKSYETGYEFFYQDSMPVQLQCKKYDHFEKVLLTDAEPVPSRGDRTILKINEKNNTKFRLYFGDDEKWTFFWIPVLSIQIDQRHQRQISFTKDFVNDHHGLDKTMPMCKDYNLGDEVQVVPSRSWQKYEKQQLKTKQLPNSDDTNHHEALNNKTDQNQASEVDLEEEVQIMPMRYFHTLSARRATCTFLNVAFIWNTVIEQYNLVDSYLYALYRKQPAQINIIFGTKGLSKDGNPDQFYKINPPDNAILQKYPIPMPKLLYRIVEYKKDDQIFNAIFIIHNLLYSVPVDERICSEESEVEGWDSIKIQRKDLQNTPELIYVCPVTLQTIQNLKANYEISENMQILKLNLFFDHIVKENAENIYQDDTNTIKKTV